MKDNFLDKLSIEAEKYRPAADGGYIVTGSKVTLGLPFSPVRYLRHGWQSWTLTAWVEASRRLPPMRPAILNPMQTDPVYARSKNPNGSWYGAVETPDGNILLLGALGLEAHVELVRGQLKGWFESGSGEWYVSMGNEAEVMGRYAGLLEARFGKTRVARPPRVWCSWYSLYTEIYEDRLLKILDDLGDLPFDIFQIDDGWQKAIGDWEANDKFPSGMQSLAGRIKSTGRMAGLWLAPLLVVPSSPVYRDHPGWLLRDGNGRPVPAGFNWSEPLYALDTTHPEALAWLADLMRKVRAWGYDYLKLDFLYAGALPGKRAIAAPRETAFRAGLRVIRESLGEAYLLTCGTPILPSLGLCDGMRVGPDVAENWESSLNEQYLMNFAAPGAHSALRTTLNRLWLQPLVNTDPDVVYFRSAVNRLCAEQKSLLQDLSRIAGFKACSDVPDWLTEGERTALREYLESDPGIERAGPASYRIDGREVDFSPFSEIPRIPGLTARLLGPLVGGLASTSVVMHLYDRITRKGIKKTLAAHPV